MGRPLTRNLGIDRSAYNQLTLMDWLMQSIILCRAISCRLTCIRPIHPRLGLAILSMIILPFRKQDPVSEPENNNIELLGDV